MIRLIVPLLVIHVAVPLFFIIWVWTGRHQSLTHWAVRCLVAGTFLLYLFLAGRWDWLSYYLRFVFVAVFLVGAYYSYRRPGKPVFLVRGAREWLVFSAEVGVLGVFLVFLFIVVRGFRYSGDAVTLSFPLKGGTYYVGQGGNSPILNYHSVHPPQSYALDIVKLNAFGARAGGFLPTELSRYMIFGDALYAPCSGVVLEAADGLPDLTPPAADTRNVAGNHIAIACGKATIILAHMMKGSVPVKRGVLVTAGQPIGRVGNSGNTSEPHLHIHAVKGQPKDLRGGQGLPILFGGRFLARNSLVIQ